MKRFSKRKLIVAAASLCVLLLLVYAAAVPSVGKRPYPLDTATRDMIKKVVSELDSFRDRTGNFPSNEQGLTVLPLDFFAPGVASQHLPKVISDAWGMPFRYRLLNGKPHIQSAGLDGTFDTQDDITN